MTPTKHAWPVLLALTLPLLLALAALDSVWTDLDNYDQVFRTSAFDYGSSVQTTQELISYFKGPVSQPFNLTGFSPKEASHLQDVKWAFKKGGLAFGLLLALWLAVLGINPRLAGKALTIGGLLTVALLVLLAIIPFEEAFTVFHGLLFEPGTWVFYPSELIVTIYPQRLFEHFAWLIFLRTAILGAACAALGWWISSRQGPGCLILSKNL